MKPTLLFLVAFSFFLISHSNASAPQQKSQKTSRSQPGPPQQGSKQKPVVVSKPGVSGLGALTGEWKVVSSKGFYRGRGTGVSFVDTTNELSLRPSPDNKISFRFSEWEHGGSSWAFEFTIKQQAGSNRYLFTMKPDYYNSANYLSFENVPLTYSRSTGFAGEGPGLIAGKQVKVQATIKLDPLGGHRWTIAGVDDQGKELDKYYLNLKPKQIKEVRAVAAPPGKEVRFVKIKAGEFLMGSEKGADQKPVHRVSITQGFEMSNYEVTQEQWETIMGSNPSENKGPHLPVINISWRDVQEFLEKLNAKRDGYVYRLPTEAEWEYACRAGGTSDYEGDIDEMAWYQETGRVLNPVGRRKPNAWGLNDMHGNVLEWCQDWHDEGYYAKSESSNPSGPAEGSYKVARGGAFNSTAEECRCAHRTAYRPVARRYDLGLRLVRVPK